MKDKEMAKQFADNISGLELTCSLLSAKDKNHAYRLGRYDGFLAGLKAGRPQWHKVADGDLPPVHLTVLNEIGDKVGYCGDGEWETYSEYYERTVEIEPPVAWCEIPKFEEDAGDNTNKQQTKYLKKLLQDIIVSNGSDREELLKEAEHFLNSEEDADDN